jgi:hypothetical protein
MLATTSLAVASMAGLSNTTPAAAAAFNCHTNVATVLGIASVDVTAPPAEAFGACVTAPVVGTTGVFVHARLTGTDPGQSVIVQSSVINLAAGYDVNTVPTIWPEVCVGPTEASYTCYL